MRRWLVIVGALLIQLCLGAIYAWSAFTGALTQPLSEGGLFGFNAKETQLVFSLGLVTFAVVMVLAGRWQAKVGPRIVAASGGVLVGLGYLGASYFGTTLTGQLVFLGLVAGAGIGLAYVCPIAVGIRWFPDRKGLITGIAVAGFGFGATIWVKLAGSWGNLIDTYGVLGTWRIYGVVFLAAILLGSIWMVYPEEKGAGAQAVAPAPSGMTPAQMLRTPQFYLIWGTFVVSAMAGLMVIGIIKLFGMDALTAAGTSAAEASIITGTAMGVFYAIFNGIGRIVWGSVSDRLGRKRSIVIMSVLQGAMMLVFYFLGSSEWLLYLGAALVGFNFGGNFALFPAVTADWFGTATVGRNYGWVFTAYGVGGILGPVMAGIFKDLDTTGGPAAWLPAFLVAGGALLVAALAMTRLSPVGRPEAPAVAPARTT